MPEVPKLLGGRYEVGELLGRGGMAEVHRGYDTRLGRQVAIKMLRSELARDNTFLVRFRREAQSAAGLNHASIVAVYDHGEDILTETGGAQVKVPYIVMEFVDGKTLRQVITERGTVGATEALRITEGVLDALGYSHRNGIVHRDIKPANVMIAPDGSIKVMDFGIARAMADANATMTQTSAVIGTAQYLSPEQAQGQSVDERSDLYSTGCMLFELLTGRAAVPRREPGLDRLPARRRAADPPVAARRGHLRGPGCRRAPLARQAARRPVPERRRVPRRPAGGAPRPPDQRCRPRLGRRPRRRGCPRRRDAGRAHPGRRPDPGVRRCSAARRPGHRDLPRARGARGEEARGGRLDRADPRRHRGAGRPGLRAVHVLRHRGDPQGRRAARRR